MRHISMDMKQMPPCHGYTHILVLLCEVSHYVVALPLHSTRIQHILEVFLHIISNGSIYFEAEYQYNTGQSYKP